MTLAGSFMSRYSALMNRLFQTPQGFIGLLVVILLLPLFVTIGLATEILILGVFALSYNLMLGFGGVLSFGHALFFGGGAYAASLLVIETGLPMIPLLLVTFALAVILAFAVGVISLRLSGIAFAMVTLAFAQLGFELVRQFREFTGGGDGLVGVYRTSPLSESGVIDLGEPLLYYGFTAVIAAICFAFTYLLANSLYGRTLEAIRVNEERTKALGVNTFWVKVSVFTVAGGMGAIAGAMWALYIRFVSPDVMFWTTTGDAILMTLIGGMYSVMGPLVGATFLQGGERLLFETQPGYWNITVGTVFVLVVLFERGGLVRVVERIADRVKETVLTRGRGED